MKIYLYFDIDWKHLSCAYDACRNVYYMTTLAEPTPTGKTRTRYFELDLNDNSLNDQIVDDYWYGLALKR